MLVCIPAVRAGPVRKVCETVYYPEEYSFMRCEDHYMLGCFLLEQSSVPIRPACRRMFLMGCVEPDINLLTFIRGTNKKRFLRGHCAQSSEKHLKKLLNKFTDAGVSTPMQWFLLGTAMHYLADSFVYVHNDYVRVRHSEHRNYEIRLHETLRVCLAKWKPGTGKSLPFAEGLEAWHEKYRSEAPSIRIDCQYVIAAAVLVYTQLRKDARRPMPGIPQLA